ncbi:MAG: PQQ-binding-like beta-propeller repeat protein [Proteobacteria bacterium]|nr:PQQ-binding-like beta-propeller repeat protein [Pseudomonadota bacterium]
MKKKIAVFSLLFLAAGCLGSSDDTPAHDYVPDVRNLAASPPAYKANILWQTLHETVSSDFIEEVGGDTVIAGRVTFDFSGLPSYDEYAAYDARTGALLWEKKRRRTINNLEATLSTDIVARTPHLVFRHTRFKQKAAQEFLAVDRRTGKEIWQLEFDSDERAVPAPGAGIIVVSYPAGRIFSHSVVAYSMETGDKLWKRSFADKGVLKERAPKIVVLGDDIYIQTDEFIRVDPKSGKTLWSTELLFPELDARMESDGVNAVLYNERKYEVLDVATGRRKNIGAFDGPVQFVLFTDQRIVLGLGPDPELSYDEANHQLQVLDAATGRPAWTYSMPFAVASNILVDKGRLVFATEIRLVGLHLKTGKESFSSARPINDAPYGWLARLVRVGDEFLIFEDSWDFETLYFRADNGKPVKRFRDKGENGTNAPIKGVDAEDAGILVSADNAARMASVRFPNSNPGGTATAYTGESNSGQAIAKAAAVRRDAGASRMDRQMAITNAYNSTVIDSSFGAAMAMANLANAVYASQEAIKFGNALDRAKKGGHRARNAKALLLRMYRDGMLIVPGWGDPHEGVFVVDFVNHRRAWVAGSPMLNNPNGRPDALKNHFQPYDISSDGKRVYLSGYGYDPSKLGDTIKMGALKLPELSIMAVDISDLPFTPFSKDSWIGWNPRAKSPDSCTEASSGILTNAHLTYAIEQSDNVRLKECWNKKLYDPDEPAYLWRGLTPLMLAALKGDAGQIDILIQMGFDPAKRRKDGLSAADFARMGGHPELSKKLAKMAGR